MRCERRLPLRRGFTLMELLVVLGVCGVLVALGMGALSSTLKEARMAREIAAAKTLITAFTQYSADNNGEILPGMDRRAGAPGREIWFEPYQRNITHSEAPHRYPFRLAPYFGYQMRGTIFNNGNDKAIEKNFGKLDANNGWGDYGVSLYPTFGINYTYVGGNYTGGFTAEGADEISYVNEVVRRMGETDVSLLVFASAGFRMANVDTMTGYFKVDPPTAGVTGSRWSTEKWTKTTQPSKFGAVDARYDGKAVCAYSNGTVKLQTIEELRDMRLWSKNAAQQDNPNYQFR